MVSTLRNNRKSSPAAHTHARSPEGVVYGNPDRHTLEAIDQVAEQMLMPRSWVVSQILREWAESRAAEHRVLEESWSGSYREQMARVGADV